VGRSVLFGHRLRFVRLGLVVVLFGCALTACEHPDIGVAFSKTPARGTTTVTVTVKGHTVTQTVVSLDSATAAPIATSTLASFPFDIDTTPLADGTHRLFVTSHTTPGTTRSPSTTRPRCSPPGSSSRSRSAG
jgi:hypothetical protein